MMTHTLRLMIPMMVLVSMTAWAQPVAAARLALVDGQTDAAEVRESAEFKLSEQTDVEINYNVTKLADGCAVHIRVYREKNGRWLVINTVLRTGNSSRGSRKLTLPAGSYRIEVVAEHARFNVAVEN